MPQTVLESPRAATRASTFSAPTLLWLAALTPAVLLVHGYHPFADDAGIYVAGIRKLVNPGLYQSDAPFVIANTHMSVFAHLVAYAVRLAHARLSAVLLATHLVSIFLFLLAGWSVAVRLFQHTAERWFAVGFAAACFTLPAAGTALVLMDPYVTSRSFSTPLGLFALAAVLDRRWGIAALFLLLMGLMHPLMVLYAAPLVLLYGVLDSGHTRGAVLLAVAAVASIGIVALVLRHAPVSPAYAQAMSDRGRTFLFLQQWRWYEDVGLIAPLALFALTAWRARAGGQVRRLCIACVLLGASCALSALLFVHTSGPYPLVRIQLLRGFHMLYLVGVLLLGAWLSQVLWQRRGTRPAIFALLAVAAAGLFAAQRAAYPNSAHIEWPGAHPHNPWAQAYLWARQNTPSNAVFAADPGLVSSNGVDMQGFRATAERSILANNKDQGVVLAVDPSLAETWLAQRDAQINVNQLSDQQRAAQLSPFGATWLLLPAGAETSFPCPYRNSTAKVCALAAQETALSAPF